MSKKMSSAPRRPKGRRGKIATLSPGNDYVVRKGLILLRIPFPMPGTRSRSSTLPNQPCVFRYATMRAALLGPISGSRSRVFGEARLMSTAHIFIPADLAYAARGRPLHRPAPGRAARLRRIRPRQLEHTGLEKRTREDRPYGPRPAGLSARPRPRGSKRFA